MILNWTVIDGAILIGCLENYLSKLRRGQLNHRDSIFFTRQFHRRRFKAAAILLVCLIFFCIYIYFFKYLYSCKKKFSFLCSSHLVDAHFRLEKFMTTWHVWNASTRTRGNRFSRVRVPSIGRLGNCAARRHLTARAARLHHHRSPCCTYSANNGHPCDLFADDRQLDYSAAAVRLLTGHQKPVPRARTHQQHTHTQTTHAWLDPALVNPPERLTRQHRQKYNKLDRNNYLREEYKCGANWEWRENRPRRCGGARGCRDTADRTQ